MGTSQCPAMAYAGGTALEALSLSAVAEFIKSGKCHLGEEVRVGGLFGESSSRFFCSSCCCGN